MPITKATSNVINLDKDVTINGITAGRGISNQLTNTVFGVNALSGTSSGITQCVAIGYEALKDFNDTALDGHTAVGYQAAKFVTGTFPVTAIGSRALRVATSASTSTAVGNNSLYNATTGSGNTAIGDSTMGQITTGVRNTAVGKGSGFGGGTGAVNTSCFGSDSAVTGNNQVQLGDSATTTYVYGTVQNRSDIRDKADIRDTQLGLDFIKELRPVDYKYDLREDYRPEMPQIPDSNATEEEKAAYEVAKAKWIEDSKLENITHDGSKKRTRYHHGLIAQEVKAVIDAKGIDFGGYQDHKIKGGDDVLSIGYDELIAPMIKAIQELSAEVASLKAQLNP
jgi:hypothetical protein